jgi:hypothetical protein
MISLDDANREVYNRQQGLLCRKGGSNVSVVCTAGVLALIATVASHAVDHKQLTHIPPYAPVQTTLHAGDCYMATTGLLVETEEHAAHLVAFAKAMMGAASQVLAPLGGPVRIRVGIHSGRVMSGIVGTLQPRCTLFGGEHVAGNPRTTPQHNMLSTVGK